MRFDWDEQKNRLNREKHGVGFAAATAVFFDKDGFEVVDDRFQYGEVRLRRVGKVGNRVFTVTFTERGGAIRIISARPSTRRERQHYDERKSGGSDRP